MNIEDELHERVCSIKFDYLDDEEAQKIATLIKKARSAPTRPKARWYLDGGFSVVQRAYEGRRIFLSQSELNKSAVNIKG